MARPSNPARLGQKFRCAAFLLSLSVLALACSSPAPAPEEAPREPAAEWVAKGRAELERGDPLAAEGSFQRAAELEPDAFEPRMWTLRAWMDQGRSNDTLDALDALDREGHKGPEMSYLYGMAFVRRAEGYIAAGVKDSSITMNFQDAVDYLAEAVDERPDEYPDAYEALATAAWFTQDLERARAAAERATALAPTDGSAWMVLGRVALSQYVLAREDESAAAQAEADWLAAKDAFAQVVGLLGSPADAAERTRLSEAAQELAQTWIWKQERAQAAPAFALAIGWAPERVDFPAILGFLGGEEPEGALFHGALEHAMEIYRSHADPSDPRAGKLLWWLGWSRHQQRDFAGAEEALRAALASSPEYVNAWYYVALSRYELQDWSGAAAALEQGWTDGPDAILAELTADPETNAARVEYLIGQVYPAPIPAPAPAPAEATIPGASLLQVAHLAEMCAETVPSEPRHWNNLGLFLRDESDRLEATATAETPPDPMLLAVLHERALAAYERALALTPEDPQVLNDTAVMLHYYLDREPERALAMYARASELAAERLAGELPADERARIETALEDSTNNRQALEELLAERATDTGR
jgi:tetratricopeptide (TPR) repeat protein